ncbi:MAG: hypothetical protein GF331_26090 [Chitinivibrionales bacterium]|nr:hypothetical protein [Chitinivibrionales bacterium]
MAPLTGATRRSFRSLPREQFMMRIFLSLCILGAVGTRAGAAQDRIIAACDTAGEWNGGHVVADSAQVGAGCLEWAHGTDDRVELATVAGDWTTHESISLWLRNDVADSAACMLILMSENGATTGMDYYSYRFELTFTGWRYFLIPRGQLSVNRAPRGWDQIDRLYFTASGWGNTPNPARTVHIDDIRLTDTAFTGPRLPETDFFALFDRGVAGLSSFFQAVDAGNHALARTRLAAYYRSRTDVPWEFDPHTIDNTVSYNASIAGDAVEGTVTVIGIPYTYPDSTIDWFYNVTEERADLADNNEWQWQLNRHSFWPQLGRAWWHTADDRYADAFVNQLRSWIHDCPRPDNAGNGPGSAWRTIDTGIRLSGSWAECWHRFLHAPSLTDDDLVLFLRSIVEQASHLRTHQTSGNWITHEMDGLYTVGGLFPELSAASEWRAFATGVLDTELDRQILPDGAQIELTTGYHYVTLDHSMNVYERASLFNLTGEMPDGYLDALERGYAYGIRLMAPDRTLPLFNDAWTNNVPYKTDAVRHCFPARADFAWCATDGAEGTPPAETSLLLPYAGNCVMRENWSDTANYLVMDAGLLGYGHVHYDKLNVVLWSNGRQILYDGGGGTYESSIWREYATSTFAHNTVNVDGLGQYSSTADRWAHVPDGHVPLVWESTDAYDFAAAVYDGGYGAPDDSIARHKRQVLYLKPDLFIVADFMIPSDQTAHEYEARWHVQTTDVSFDGGSGVAVTEDSGEPNLAVVPLLQSGRAFAAVSAQSGAAVADIAGWWVVKNGGRRPTTTVLHTVSGAGPRCLLTLLHPILPNAGSDIVSVEETGVRAANVLLLDGRTLHVSLSADTGGAMTAVLENATGDTAAHVTVDGTVRVAEPSVAQRSRITSAGVRLRRTSEGLLLLRGVLPGDRVALFGLTGRLLWSRVVDGSAEIAVPERLRGFVIVSVHRDGRWCYRKLQLSGR